MSAGVGVALAVLILVNAFYVAAEFGAVGVRRSRVRRMSDEGHGLARRLLPHIEHPAGLSRYVAASQLGITVSSLLVGAVAQATLAVAVAPFLVRVAHLDAVAAQSTAAVVVLVALAAVQAVVGEFVPKTVALQFPTEIALATVLPMQWSLKAFKPFILLINGATSVLLRLVGTKPATQRNLHSPDEIEMLLAESRDGGLLEPDEQQRLHRALRLELKTARDLMVPLARLTMLPVETAWDDVVRLVAESSFSRLPVFRGSRDNIIGALRVTDLVRRFVTEGPMPLSRLVRPVVRVAEDLPADRVLSVFRERQIHLAVVVSTGDHAVGMVTLQDLLVELIGMSKPPGGVRAS